MKLDELPKALQSSAQQISNVLNDYRWAEIVTIQDIQGAWLEVELQYHVALPSKWRTKGVTHTGVRAKESVYLAFPPAWPMEAPLIRLRGDFNRNLPHINPISDDEYVYPCIYPEGKTNDLLHQRDGLYSVLQQIKDWLDRAACDGLYDENLGWEPIIASPNKGELICDLEKLQSIIKAKGSHSTHRVIYSHHSNEYCLAMPLENPEPAYPKTLKIDEKGIGRTCLFLIWGDEQNVTSYRDVSSISSLEALYDLAKTIGAKGYLRNRVQAFVKHYQKHNSGIMVSFFVFIVLNRPAHLSGVSHNKEFIPFWVQYPLVSAGERNATAALLQHRQQLTPEFAARLSGVRHKHTESPIVLVGCGSLGSKLGLHLGKSGETPFLLIDSATFSPHQLIRHGLTPKQSVLQQNKVDLLASTLKNLNVKVETKPDNIATIFKKSPELLSNSRLILDTTASPYVREMFANSTFQIPKGRLAHSALHAAGEAAHLLLEGPDRNPRVDDLHAWMLDRVIDHPTLGPLLFSTDPKFSPHPIGQGCTSLTMTMSDAQASLHAASIAKQTSKYLANEMPNSGEVWLGYSDASDLGVNWENFPLERTIILNPEQPGLNGWEVRILSVVKSMMQKDMAHYNPLESGGPLYGHINRHLRRITVTRTTPAPVDSTRTRNHFTMGVKGLKEEVRNIEKRSNAYFTFLGTWHSHPAGGNASLIDEETLEYFAQLRNGPPFLMLIMNSDKITGMVKSSFDNN